MNAKEMKELNLTEPRIQVLQLAAQNENGRLPFGNNQTTINALKFSGYIDLHLRNGSAELERLTNVKLDHIERAKTALAHDSWQAALGHLQDASTVFQEAGRKEWRITAKGREIVTKIAQDKAKGAISSVEREFAVRQEGKL
jgi:hypothetical protein